MDNNKKVGDNYKQIKEIEESYRIIKYYQDNFKIIKYYFHRLDKVMRCYRCLINDLDNNKVQNFTDRMRKIKKMEATEEVDCLFYSIGEIIEKSEEDLDVIKKKVREKEENSDKNLDI